MAAQRPRPLSPHLTIWRWGPGMAASIFHRITGGGLAVAGLAVLTWWLMALARGPEPYAAFLRAMSNPLGLIVLVGLSWAFFQHLLSGVRHLVMDTGAGFDLGTNKRFAVATFIGAIVLTIALWAVIFGAKL